MNLNHSMIRCSAALVAALCTPLLHAEKSGAKNLDAQSSRLVEIPVSPSTMNRVSRDLWGQDVDAREGGTRGCQNISTYLGDGFNGTQWTAQAGFAESEIFAASYQAPSSMFPIRIDTMQALFVTAGTTVTTTTQWSVLVWQGRPDTGTLVASFSSDDVVLPHLVMPPGNNGTVLEVSVDPNDPEQIVIQDDGTGTFSIGFRIDQHNNQTQNPCFTAPPSNSNAFPATDTDGLADATNNWLFGVNCGPFGCPANGGWSTFAALPGLCRPSGDWALSATWTSLPCTPGVGACCLPDGSCSLDSQGNCEAAGGVFQGDGTVCEDVVCQPLPQACCFASTGACLNLDPGDCVSAGGVPGGVGTSCDTFTCFPQGACCLPDGSCADGLSPEECAAMNGTYEGNDTTCAATNCPEPTGGCCFSNGFCLELTEADCALVEGLWGGLGSDCADLDGDGISDLCQGPAGCNAADVAAPFGVLDLSDISAFVTAFMNQDPLADLADPQGVFDLADLGAFVTAFVAGCP